MRIFAITGGLWLFIEMLDFFQVYTRDKYSAYAFLLVLAAAIVVAVFTRRPVSRIKYKIPKKDFSYEVAIGDLLSFPGNIVISSSTTFDTDIASGLISPQSLQGQMALKFFQGNTAEIDRQLNESLKGVPSTHRASAPGKKETYPAGTVAKVKSHGRTFYFVAMSDLNQHGNAESSIMMIEYALEGLWKFIGDQGELEDVGIPVMGTGRGRVQLPRKKMIERIAQSFADASRDKVFCNKLSIFVHPNDAAKFNLNLFEVRDYLVQSLHV